MTRWLFIMVLLLGVGLVVKSRELVVLLVGVGLTVAGIAGLLYTRGST